MQHILQGGWFSDRVLHAVKSYALDYVLYCVYTCQCIIIVFMDLLFQRSLAPFFQDSKFFLDSRTVLMTLRKPLVRGSLQEVVLYVTIQQCFTL